MEQPTAPAPRSISAFFCAADIAGNVEVTQQIEVENVTDIEPPLIEVSADPLQLWPPNNKLVPVRIFGTAFDTGSGIRSIHIEVVDEYGECEPVIQDILPDEIIDGMPAEITQAHGLGANDRIDGFQEGE